MITECVVGVHTLNSYNKILERILLSDDPRGYPPSPKAGGVWGGESTAHVNKKFSKYHVSLISMYSSKYNITCKVLLLQGLKDDLLPSSSSEYVYNTVKSKIKKLVYFKNENHNLLRDKNKEEIFSIIDKFLKHDKKGGIYNLWQKKSQK